MRLPRSWLLVICCTASILVGWAWACSYAKDYGYGWFGRGSTVMGRVGHFELAGFTYHGSVFCRLYLFTNDFRLDDAMVRGTWYANWSAAPMTRRCRYAGLDKVACGNVDVNRYSDYEPVPTTEWYMSDVARFPDGASTYSSYAVRIPFWLVLGLVAAVPSFYAIRCARRLWHGVPGLCGKCGYDLRASKDRCPECGEPIPEAATQQASS